MLVLSLFPGIGLLDHAFELEGFTVVRGPDCLWGGDIRRFHPPAGKFDGIIGGPPCQTFSSLAHLVRANGHEPKFGNLIPEFERCVRESQPDWFLMENVPAAPTPNVAGYGIHSFLLDNAALAGPDGLGQEQMRLRRLSFGLRGREPVNLRRWIDLAALVLSEATPSVTGSGGGGRRQAVLSDTRAVPVAIGGSGKRKRTVTGGHGQPPSARDSDDRNSSRRYRLAEALRLQGLPDDFLEHAPFTVAGKLKAVANGVAIPTGRALAKAINRYFHEVADGKH